MSKLNPDFLTTLKKFGAFDTSVCFNCGNCTAICSLSNEDNSFPRKMVRSSVLGLEEKIVKSLDPWLCYYCGECSSTCPREANPGELMMSLRRYLISVYDWTGLSRKFYTSKRWEFFGIFVLAAIIFLIWALIFGLPTSSEGKTFNLLAPAETVHIIDVVLAVLLSVLLISFIFNMYLKVLKSDKSLKIPLKLYITELLYLVFHFITQWRFSDCEKEPESFFKRLREGQYNYWVMHFLLMSGYSLLFLLIVVFLPWFQGKDETYNWFNIQRIIGFYATIGLIVGSIYFLIRRIKKDNEKSKFSHSTDWIFPILLTLTALTGIGIFFCRIFDAPLIGFYIYLIHLMVAVPMLAIEVPFSKWSHLAYRPIAIYFDNIRKAAYNLKNKTS
jgi:quinone-modifying oxidoreductase, subunit QmoC